MRNILPFTSLFVYFCGCAAGKVELFDQCKSHIERILNGTETDGPVNNQTIWKFGYIYHGPVAGINPDFPREDLLTITRKGCLNLCGDFVDWYWVSDITLTLSIVSNWVIPIIALLAVIPYESFDGRKNGSRWARAGRIVKHLLNWLGSPQTALTAVLFNIQQMAKCFRVARKDRYDGTRPRQKLKMDAYYVLSCISQFEVPENTALHDALLYSLFKPLCANGQQEQGSRAHKAELWTAQLLRTMARQLRLTRRRGLWPMIASIVFFFVAYIVSLVTAFSSSMGDRTTTHSLAFGILISWFPLLTLFAIVDRNPISAERTCTLISRWIANGKAVKVWEASSADLDPIWWNPSHHRYDNVQGDNEGSATNSLSTSSLNWDCALGAFIGQGRKIGYNGFAYAVISAITEAGGDDSETLTRILKYPTRFLTDPRSLNDGSDRPKGSLLANTRDPVTKQGGFTSTTAAGSSDNGTRSFVRQKERRPPAEWWVLSVLACLLVLVEIGMAIMMSSTVPTVGIGCRSGLYIIYCLLSMATWFLHLFPWFRRQGRWAEILGLVFCVPATLCLIFITFAAFSGVLKNCICRSGLSGYLDFENAAFYRNKERFDMTQWWWAAAIIGAIPLLGLFLVAVALVLFLQPLWQDDAGHDSNDRRRIEHQQDSRQVAMPDMVWLD